MTIKTIIIACDAFQLINNHNINNLSILIILRNFKLIHNMNEQMKEPLDIGDAIQKFPENNLQIMKHNFQNTDPKTIHDKINNYQKLDTEERLNLIKNLPIMLQQLGNQGIPPLKPLLLQILKDREDLSRSMLHHLRQIYVYLQKHQGTANNIKNILIPVLIDFLNFNSLQIKQQAGKQLGLLAHELDDKDRGDCVLRHVIQMAHDDSNQDNRIVAVQLFSSMSQCFGKSLCQQFIGLQFLSLGQDTSFKVRKQAIIHLPTISRLVSKPFFSRLFAFYAAKSKDGTNWAIRKACVDIVIDIAQMCTNQQKENQLTEIMCNLLKDANKWVRSSAYKNLGNFIYCLKGLKINEKLVFQFCRMVNAQVYSIGKQNQILYNCAYNFPAVLDALGPDSWEDDLHEVYQKLLKQNDKKIKITLSESLHEVAKIIGQQKTQQYLFKVVDTFFKDKSDQIKLGVIKHMSDIMHVLSQEKRQSLIGVFQQFQKDQKKWRIRQCIGKQLDQILQIYKPQTIFYYVIPILLKFCSDNVSIVRQQAARKVGAFLQKLGTQQGLVIGLIESVKAFGASPKYTQRQTFLIMCQSLMQNKQSFKTNFLPTLLNLANDKVINVRLVLAQIVNKHMLQKGALCQEQEFLALRNKLANDENQEIKVVFQEQ